MEYKLYCVEQVDNIYKQVSKRTINDDELHSINKACNNINTLKLLYEIPYSLKNNYTDFIKYIEQTPAPSNNFSHIWTINLRIIECNRLIFNLVSSLNAIENHYKKILKENDDEFENVLKLNYISKHYDESLDYRFLYELRNYVNHAYIPATLAEFHFTSKIDYNKMYADKNSFLNDAVFKKKVKEDIKAQYPNEIDIYKIIKNEIPIYINILLSYVKAYAAKIDKDIKLIKNYERILNRRISTNNVLIYGVETPNKPGTFNIILPVDFIRCYENNELYNDILE